VDDRYIPVVTSSKPDLTAAVCGTFSGPPGVESELEWEITAEILSSAIR
jgi:hypothetical protein